MINLEPIKARLESESWISGILVSGSELNDLVAEVERLRDGISEIEAGLAHPRDAAHVRNERAHGQAARLLRGDV